MKLTEIQAAQRSFARDEAFAVYYANISAWGHRAWDNALVIYGNGEYHTLPRDAKYATFFNWENQGNDRVVNVEAAYIIYKVKRVS